MKTSQFDYHLPEKYIAQNPATPRDSSKLLVYEAKKNRVFHEKFSEIVDFLKTGDVLVINTSKVIPARINFQFLGKKFEIFLLKKIKKNFYQTLVRPGKKFKVGEKFILNKNLDCTVKEILDDGTRIIEFHSSKLNVENELEKIGKAPFPPYIKQTRAKLGRYQTVYAKENGSVAAPTAGLHWTKKLFAKLDRKGVKIVNVILHVGLGTFLPVKTDNIEDHNMHSEFFELPKRSAKALNDAKKSGRRIIAVGTTSVRVLESCYTKRKGFVPQKSDTKIFIYPGYKWSAVDALVTNFHLPKSTLLMLVSSFLEHKGSKAPIKGLFKLYDVAKKNNYRFYSFGDAMFIF
jgi:S-adenosylmethionine:tRNA ribosyltransferase-isomerase